MHRTLAAYKKNMSNTRKTEELRPGGRLGANEQRGNVPTMRLMLATYRSNLSRRIETGAFLSSKKSNVKDLFARQMIEQRGDNQRAMLRLLGHSMTSSNGKGETASRDDNARIARNRREKHTSGGKRKRERVNKR
jgi:hypothetical protein